LRKLSREPGLYLSGAAHVSALVLMLAALPAAKPFDDAVEAVPVEMMTADQFASLTPGSAAEKDISPNPKPKSEPAPKPAKADGELKAETKPSVLPPPPRAAEKPAKDKPAPKKPEKLAEKPKPAAKPPAQPKQALEEPPPLRTASLPPKQIAPKPADKAKAAVEEEKDADEVIRQLQAEEAERARQAAAKLREQRKAEAKAKADAEAKNAAAEAARKEAEAEKRAERKKAEAAKQAAAEAEREAAEAKRLAAEKAEAAAEKAKLAEAAKAKAAAAAAEKKAAAKAAAAEQARKDKLAALIKSKQSSDRTQDDGSDNNQINATKASTAAKSGEDAPDPQSSGGSKRAGSSLSPAQKEGLANAIIDQMRSCVTNLGGDDIGEAPRIRISIGPDGSLQGAPKIIRAADAGANALARAAMRGARSCAPFDIPAQYRAAMADADGADLTLTLNPSDLQ
jgi:colicin import membrane protein